MFNRTGSGESVDRFYSNRSIEVTGFRNNQRGQQLFVCSRPTAVDRRFSRVTPRRCAHRPPPLNLLAYLGPRQMAPASAQRRELKCHLFLPESADERLRSPRSAFGVALIHATRANYVNLIIVFRRDRGTDIADKSSAQTVSVIQRFTCFIDCE